MEPQGSNKEQFGPSRAFIIRGSIATAIVLLLLLVQTAWFKSLFHKKATPTVKDSATIGELVGKDTNQNGIADWEERLWGLDPSVLTTNGVANKTIIEERKKALGITDADQTPENETDLLAKQLFSITTAVSQSGTQSEAALKSLGTGLGDGVNLKQITNHYTRKSIKTVATSTQSLAAYYKAVSAITARYPRLSDGVDALIQSLETGDLSGIETLGDTSATYRAYANDLMTVPAPVGVAEYHLALMNGFYGMGDAFSYIAQMADNGIYGVVGIQAYKEYALKVDAAQTELRDYFVQYGILKE